MVPSLTCPEATGEALFHSGPYRLLGRKLAPFCYRHFKFLEQLESPLVRGGAVTLRHLQQAAIVCSTTSEQHYFEAARAPRGYWRTWWWVTGHCLPRPALSLFNRYVTDYFPSFPVMVKRGAGEGPEGLDGLTVALARLVAARGREVKEWPLGEALLWSMALCEARGQAVPMLTANDLEELRRVEAETP